MASYTTFGKINKKKEEVKLVGNVFEVTTRDEKIEHLKKSMTTGQLVVVDIYSDSCQPCKMIAPKYYELSLKYSMVVFLKEKVELEISPGILNVPCFQFFGGGKLIENVVGADMGKFEGVIQKYLSMKSPSDFTVPQPTQNPIGNPPIPQSNKPIQPLPPVRNQKPFGVRR